MGKNKRKSGSNDVSCTRAVFSSRFSTVLYRCATPKTEDVGRRLKTESAVFDFSCEISDEPAQLDRATATSHERSSAGANWGLKCNINNNLFTTPLHLTKTSMIPSVRTTIR